jgi:hypothetical protein
MQTSKQLKKVKANPTKSLKKGLLSKGNQLIKKEAPKTEEKPKQSFWKKLGQIVKESVDCCIE